jgi:hypothetical protein
MSRLPETAVSAYGRQAWFVALLLAASKDQALDLIADVGRRDYELTFMVEDAWLRSSGPGDRTSSRAASRDCSPSHRR